MAVSRIVLQAKAIDSSKGVCDAARTRGSSIAYAVNSIPKGASNALLALSDKGNAEMVGLTTVQAPDLNMMDGIVCTLSDNYGTGFSMMPVKLTVGINTTGILTVKAGEGISVAHLPQAGSILYVDSSGSLQAFTPEDGCVIGWRDGAPFSIPVTTCSAQ